MDGRYEGYEIHSGLDVASGRIAFVDEGSIDASRSVFGTYLRGLFVNAETVNMLSLSTTL
jgi:cobyric acid synthase